MTVHIRRNVGKLGAEQRFLRTVRRAVANGVPIEDLTALPQAAGASDAATVEQLLATVTHPAVRRVLLARLAELQQQGVSQ